MMMSPMDRLTFLSEYKYRLLEDEGDPIKHCGNCAHYTRNSQWLEIINPVLKSSLPAQSCTLMLQSKIPAEQTYISCHRGICDLWQIVKEQS